MNKIGYVSSSTGNKMRWGVAFESEMNPDAMGRVTSGPQVDENLKV